MDLIFIIIFIIIILTVMIMAYIPFELQTLAKKADFSSFSLRYMILKIQKVPMKYLFEQFEKLSDNDIEEDFDDLVKLWRSNPKETESIIHIMLTGKKAGKNITLNDISAYKITEKNHKRFIQILDAVEDPRTDIPEENMIKLINSDLDIPKYFNVLKNAKEYNFRLPEDEINSENLDELMLLTLNLKSIKDAKIEFDDTFLADNNINYHTKAKLLSIIPTLNKSDIAIETKDITKLETAGINFTELTDAVLLLRSEKIKVIDKEQVIQHYLKGGNGSRVVNSFIKAKKSKTEINSDTLFKLDIEAKEEYDNIVSKCIDIYEFEVSPPAKVLLKDGLQISIQIMISAKDSINRFKSNSENNELIKFINNIVSSESEKFSSHTKLLKNLKDLSEKIESRVLNSEIFKDQFVSFSVKITDLIINKDTLEDIRKSEAKEDEEKEKIKLLKAKRKLEEDMAKAVEKGKLSYNDYLKEKYIFNDDDKDLPYHTD